MAVGRKAKVENDDIQPIAKRTRAGTNEDMMDISIINPKPITLPNEDEVLIEMIRSSGARSHSEVAQFCLSVGIPLSRMLRLDLMRQTPSS